MTSAMSVGQRVPRVAARSGNGVVPLHKISEHTGNGGCFPAFIWNFEASGRRETVASSSRRGLPQ